VHEAVLGTNPKKTSHTGLESKRNQENWPVSIGNIPPNAKGRTGGNENGCQSSSKADGLNRAGGRDKATRVAVTN